MSGWDQAPLLRTPVLILDCQATGANPRQGHLLEVGWALALPEPAAPLDTESTLVQLPPPARIPRQVSRITGIREEDLASARPPQEAWAMLQARAAALGGPWVPAVIHFARYERPFLRALEESCAGPEAVGLRIFCTHEIARRLYPRLPRRGIRALAGFLGSSLGPLRRSAEHVAATAFIWRMLVTALTGREGLATFAQLGDWLERPAPSARGNTYPMPRQKRLGLPDQPGVYRMYRPNGDLLYVGKARSLRQRVNSYFRKQSGIPERTLELLSQAVDLSVTVTATALEAALLEHDEIKAWAPPYNVALRGEGRQLAWYSPDLERLSARPDSLHRLGPLPGLDPLGPFRALLQLLEGAPGKAWAEHLPSDLSGLPQEAAPGPGVLREGLELFGGLYGPALAPSRAGRIRQLLTLGAALRRQESLREELERAQEEVQRAGPQEEPRDEAGGGTGEAERGVTGRDGSGEEAGGDSGMVWDGEAVCRLLCGILRHTVRLWNRSRWLLWLSESTLAFREPEFTGDSWRVLHIRGALVAERADGKEGPLAPPERAARPLPERAAGLNFEGYERLRVLNTEIRRLAARGAPLALVLWPDRRLENRGLGEVLRWV